ncbi:DNA-binding protein [Corynebacterium falsenii]|uniref:DNA-binding protein n=1 Tax=Corynebacterium falsenii TaxID=108486 RepID=A0A418Q811_9CORY|nr:DNA-binding protein [Corynebacterium falsenii]
MSLKEAADRVGVSVKTLRRRIAEGNLPAYRSGRIIRVRAADVDEMMQPVNPWAAVK